MLIEALVRHIGIPSVHLKMVHVSGPSYRSRKLLMSRTKRKYSDTYLKFGITFTVNSVKFVNKWWQAIHCGSMSSHSISKERSSRIQTWRLTFSSRGKQWKTIGYKWQIIGLHIKCAAMKASYEASLTVTKQKLAHITGWKLCSSSCKNNGVLCIWRWINTKIKPKSHVYQYTTTTKWRNVGGYLAHVVCEISRAESGFAIQLDESTEKCSKLLFLSRTWPKKAFKEKLLFDSELDETTNRDNTFQIVHLFFNHHGRKISQAA